MIATKDRSARWRKVGWGAATSVVVAGLLLGGAAQPAQASTGWSQTNLALKGTATQSSTWSGLASATADKAIDGNTDGKLENGSVTHTDIGMNSWWQVDLGASHPISAIEVFNRADCCTERLNGARLFVSNAPFDTSLDPAAQAAQPGVTTFELSGAAKTRLQKVDRAGRYVMVQAPGWSLFSLAEVKVLGSDTLPSTVVLDWRNLPLDTLCADRLYFTVSLPQTCSGPTDLQVMPNSDGTVRLRTAHLGQYIRYAPETGALPFVVDGDGDPSDPGQSFLIVTEADGSLSIRNADGTYWAVLDDHLTTVPASKWQFDPGVSQWNVFGLWDPR